MRLKQLRKENNLTQDEVAKLLNIFRSRYNIYEREKTDMPIKYLIMLANFYGVSIDYLVGETDVKERNMEVVGK